MLSKNKTTGKRGAFGMAPSLMALSLAAFGVPAAGLLVPAAAYAADSDCDISSFSDDDVYDGVTCGYDSAGFGQIDITLPDTARVDLSSTKVLNGGVVIVGPNDANDVVGGNDGYNPDGDGVVRVYIFDNPDDLQPVPSIINDTNGDGAFNYTSSGLDGLDFELYFEDGSLSATFAGGEGMYIETDADDSDIYLETEADTTINSDLDDGIDLHTYGTNSYIDAVIGGDVTAGNNGGDVALGAIVHDWGNIDLTVEGTADFDATGNGIEAQVLGTTTEIDESDYGNITITTNGDVVAGDDGIFANNNSDGDIVINVQNTYNIDETVEYNATIDSGAGAGDQGILATASGLGSITIDVDAAITSGGDGIQAWITNAASSAAIEITQDGTIVTELSDGVYADNLGDGEIDIEVYGNITATAGTTGAGVWTRAQGGGVTWIDQYSDSTILADDYGIFADADFVGGGGDIDIDARGDITVGDANGVGIFARNRLGGDIDVWTSRGNNIDSDTGIYAFQNDITGTGAIDIDAYGDISGTNANGAGIRARTFGTGNVEVYAGRSVEITGDGDGILAQIDHDNTAAGGSLTVTSYADITSNTNDGIQTDNDGAGTTTINVHRDIAFGNSANGSDSGIQANNTGAGNLAINTFRRSDITGMGKGIEARTNTGTGTLTLDLEGDVDTDTGANFIELYVNSNVAGATVTLQGSADINVGDGTDMAGRGDDLVMDAIGGATAVANYGTIWGRIDLTEASDTFTNYSNTTWAFTGTSLFGGGSDTLENAYTNNDTQGRIVNALDDDVAETAQYDGLEFFENFGTVSLVDTSPGDTFYRDRAYTDGAYEGDDLPYTPDSDNYSTIEVDALLGDPTTSDSDRFIIQGAVTGYTGVAINDIDTGYGYFDDLIPVIEVGTETSGDGHEFYLLNPLDKGLYTYDLYFIDDVAAAGLTDSNDTDGTGTDDSESLANTGLTAAPADPVVIQDMWVLKSYADASVNNLSAIPGIIAGNWNALAEGWQERSGDLRNYFMEPAGPLAYAPSDVILPTGETRDIGIWGRLVGVGGERTGSAEVEVLPGVFETLDTGYREQLVGGQAGIDFAFHLEDSTVVFGLMGAYAQSEVAFNSGDTASLTTPSIGAYADWIMGGTYFNALAKVDFIGLDYNYGVDSDTTTGLAIGGALEAGHRFDFDSLFIEPVARVSYVETDLDTFNIGPDEVDLYGSSFQAKAGGRVGGSFATETYTVAPYVSGYIGYEFLGESSVEVESLMDPVSTDFSGAFAEIGAGVNVDDVDGSGLTGFADANVLVAEDYLGASASVGVRANF